MLQTKNSIMETNKDQQQQAGQQDENKQKLADPAATQQMNELEEQADENRTKKPGSQANGSDQHNNGRGGGK